GGEAMVFPPLLQFPARSQHVQPRCAGRDSQDHGLLDSAWRVRLPHGCRSLRDRRQGSPLEQYDMLRGSANSCNGASAIRSFSPKRTFFRTDMEYFGDAGDRMHMMFNFQVNQNLFYALATADTRPLARAMQKTKKRPASGQWGVFLRNHDELD